ncbi:MAG: cell wall hydrolase [Clostridia bacterium]|nr:cell wall hydrolase [Clostridia bacterium]
MVKKQNAIFKILSLLLFLCLSFSLFSFTANEAHAVAQEEERSGKSYLAVKGIQNTRTGAYTSVPIRRNGTSLGIKSLIINDTYYVPVRAFLGYVAPDMKVSYSNPTKTLTVSGGGLYLTAADGSYAVYANDRVLFDMTPARLMSDGRMYIPAKTLAKALGLRVAASGSALNFSGSVSPILPGSKFYASDAVYWLSRIISAESRGEPLIGQIAVGNVIMNRVRSKSFPNTIWGVIFDRKYGIQFSPVANGTIYEAPVFTATLAAKVCLEGFSVSEDILYFLAPRYATSSWIANNRPYVFTVKNHEFYA